METNLNNLSKTLIEVRKDHKFIKPIKAEAQKFINDLMQLLFPHLTADIYYSEEDIKSKLILLKRNLKFLLKLLNNNEDKTIDKISNDFFGKIENINSELWNDAQAIYEGDPAAHSVDEVILAYPGFKAIAIFRFAHVLFDLNVPILPRILTEYAHQETGIDIHPGAKIGHSFFIDHGTGIVIGETCEIGNNVKIYQGVTLGARSFELDVHGNPIKGIKRHPKIEDNVIIYSHATILGGDTVIGHDSIIGASVWLMKSVPPHSTIYYNLRSDK